MPCVARSWSLLREPRTLWKCWPAGQGRFLARSIVVFLGVFSSMAGLRLPVYAIANVHAWGMVGASRDGRSYCFFLDTDALADPVVSAISRCERGNRTPFWAVAMLTSMARRCPGMFCPCAVAGCGTRHTVLARFVLWRCLTPLFFFLPGDLLAGRPPFFCRAIARAVRRAHPSTRGTAPRLWWATQASALGARRVGCATRGSTPSPPRLPATKRRLPKTRRTRRKR